MSEIQTKTVQIGPGFLGLLGVAFIVLKLCGVIGWSWWWVTVPLWGPLALILGGFTIFVAVIGIVAVAATLVDR